MRQKYKIGTRFISSIPKSDPLILTITSMYWQNGWTMTTTGKVHLGGYVYTFQWGNSLITFTSMHESRLKKDYEILPFHS